MDKIKITQKKSIIGANKRQKATMKTLKLKRIGGTAVHTLTPAIAGMVEKISHLITVEKI